MKQARPDEILKFWFSGLNDQQLLDKKDPRVKRWFVKDARFDEEIRRCFESDLVNAGRGEYKEWEESAAGCLALVILFDQFSRNLYRNTQRMYAWDASALALTLRSIDKKLDSDLQLIERIFLYMPLMHPEDLATQELSLKYFGQLVKESQLRSPQNSAYFEYTFNYAQKHHAVINRFGRFPHRNAVLNRPSSAEEKDFLLQPGSFF